MVFNRLVFNLANRHPNLLHHALTLEWASIHSKLWKPVNKRQQEYVN